MRTAARGAALAALLAFGAAACDGVGADPDGGSTPTESPTDDGPTTVGTTKGEYEYRNAGLTAEMKLKGDQGTLEIANETGFDLPKPGFYILDARDGSVVEGKVVASEPVPDGATKSFDVSFSPPIELKNIGLVILLMGDDNYGAFVLR